MKIVQSLWSEPSKSFGGYEHYHGRWPHPRHFWHSWVISAGWAQRHYGELELVTDDDGARWLVDRLRLPFTSVRMELNGLDVSPELWSAGKIVAFSAQREPFFHIDGDVYLTGTLPPSYEGVDALCQFLEMRGSYPNFEGLYDSHRLTIESNLAWLPECWRFMSEGVSGNCGIIGGANLQAIHRYADDALRTLLNPLNQSGWNRIAIRSPMNCVIEQQMLWASMRAQDVVLTPLFTEEDFQCEDRLRAKALSSNFNHAAVEGKCVALGMQLEKLVEAQFPEQHRIISDLYPRSIESLAMPMQLISEFDNVVETPNISMVEIVRLQDRPRPKSNGQQTFNRKPRPQRDDGRA